MLKAAALVLALFPVLWGCEDGGDGGDGTAEGRRSCERTCERFKTCIPNLKDNPGQIWVCRCGDNEALWASAGACIEACAVKSSCDDLWAYFTHSMTGSAHLYLTAFYACEQSCR
jgi:hypothetical protein